jgi:hypothetical protein
VPVPPVRYVSSDEDSARWQQFRFRDGDIVISTRSKSGTTWMQMICARLVFGTPDVRRGGAAPARHGRLALPPGRQHRPRTAGDADRVVGATAGGGGSSGAGHAVLTPDELARYEERAAELAPGDLLGWLHR